MGNSLLKDVLNFCLKKLSDMEVYLLYHIVVLIYKKDQYLAWNLLLQIKQNK